MFKKLFTLLIAVSMLLTMTYIPALASDSYDGKDILPDGWMELKSNVAQIGDVKYKTLEEAIAAAQEGGNTIELLSNVEEAGPFEIANGEVTVVGNGYTIYCEEGFLVSGGTLTLSDDLSVEASTSAALCVSGGKVITSANLKATGESAAIQAADECEGTVTVIGGTVESDGDSCIEWSQSGNLSITGGVFSSDPSEYCAPGYIAEDLSDEGKYEVKKDESVVAIGEDGTVYYNFQTALTAINDARQGKLSLAKDVSGETAVNVLPGVTLDLNGYTLETEFITVYNGAYLIDSSAGSTGLLKCAKGNAVVMTNVTMDNGAVSDGNNLLVWDENRRGYILTDYSFSGTALDPVTEDGVSKLNYKFSLYTEAHARALFGSPDNDLSVIVRITWTKTDSNGNVTNYSEDVCFSDALVGAVVEANGGSSLSVMVSGGSSYENLAFQSIVLSGTQMVACTAPIAASTVLK